MFTFDSIDFCAGGGLASLGAEQAGARVKIAIDLDPYAAACYRKNFPGVEVINRSLENVSPEEIVMLTGLGVGEFSHFHCSWPCQLNSTANTKAAKKNPKDNNAVLYSFLKTKVEPLRPAIFTCENVDGAAKGLKKLEIQKIHDYIESIGYHPEIRILNSFYYGVPQQRLRLFIIAVRQDVYEGQTIQWPKHSTVTRVAQDVNPKLQMFRSKQFAKREWSAKNPIQTITASDSIEVFESHWREATIEELKDFMGVPSAFILPGRARAPKVRVLGNGVPPPLMKAVMQEVARLLQNYNSKKK